MITFSVSTTKASRRHWHCVPAVGEVAFLGCSIVVLAGLGPDRGVEIVPSRWLCAGFNMKFSWDARGLRS